MFTNRDEVLEKALRIFAKMNYEKASQMEIAENLRTVESGTDLLFPVQAGLVHGCGGQVRVRYPTLEKQVQLHGRLIVRIYRPVCSRSGEHDAAARAPAGRREQSQRVQLQLLLLPPADAGKAVLSQRGEKDSRHIRAELTALEIRHREGEGKRGNRAGCGCG